MSLKKYIEKRHFERTPEPAPSASPAPALAGKSGPRKTRAPADEPRVPLRFCVQRHHATNLHYDLRLEVDGVLKSWAVPKGPSLDPARKNLAMMVEDHPMEYGGFEGVIPKGNYGAGSVMLWDQGTYEPLGEASPEEQLKRGDFKFKLNGEKLAGEFAIVHMKPRAGARSSKGNEWLLIKKKDAAAQPGWDPNDHAVSALTGRTQEEIARGLKATPKKAAAPKHNLSKVEGASRSEMPREVAPMLAEIGRGEPPSGRAGWIYEIKWDGVRAICYLDSGKLRLVSRNGNSMEKQYPELSILPHHVNAKQAILDGEVAALDERGLPSFERLQSRINVSEASSIATLSRNLPVVLYLFDILYLDGYDLRGVELTERKRLLKEILTPGDIIRYSDDFPDGPGLYAAARAQGLEGIIGKRASSCYESRRTSDWVKYKILSSESFVICGYTAGERDYFGALVLGIYEHGRLRWAGNVGTGFDRKMMKTIHDKLQPLVTDKPPVERHKLLPKSITWVRPELVCEVRFSNWTEDGRLRAPVWVGFRPDIDPEECSLEKSAPQPAADTSAKADDATAPLLDESQSEAILTIDGHRLKFTNLNKPYYPKDGIVKRDLLNYYNAVAPLILPYLKDRALSLRRYPDGIDGEAFFQKQVNESFPKWLRMEEAPDEIRYVIGEDRATLLFLVNLGCIDHNPWMSRMQSPANPDYMLIDLDPQDCGYEKIVEAAQLVRKKLDKCELESYPKTTGGDGMHLYVPLQPIYTYEQVRSLAEVLASLCAAERPDLFTTPRAVSRREKGKVYFDWAQIAQGKTISAPYVLRAHPGAPVATPLAWREVTPKLRPEQFHIGNSLARFDRVGDLFEGVLNRPQTIDKAVEKIAGGL